ncbi:hypothetical protein GHK92_09285 [Nocardioides sp. dk4132]|uniref:T3SS (YopN, CesT) and YbjN peptide-binding chaperone 1 n=1 Tax=unclassified Nocardioides TaxID=2615069 RepID=UPI001295E808|nr:MULTISPECIES: hypothetical protein [unclassified Nocardioides]MQW76067.1 hypothetical protein [Nocardioides sp. dk4132]QGA08915.1 hypothetical protein GFH29_17040 [Nocardioides sp. dk884]
MHEQRDGFDQEVDAAWRRFRRGLADELAALEVRQAVHVGLSEAQAGAEEDPAYVVFVRDGADRLRLEAGGGDPDPQQMLDLGWGAPRLQATGESVHELEAPVREVDRLATLSVTTLREVHGALHPALLEVDGLGAWITESGESRESVQPADSEAAHQPIADEPLATVPLDDEHLRGLVQDALRPMTAELVHTDDGDLVVPVSDDHAVVVRVLHDEPALDLLMEVVCDVVDHDRAALELELLNRDATFGRYLLWDGSVMITHRVLAMPFAPVALRGTVAVLVEEVERVAGDLHARLGGRLPLEREVAAPRRTPVALHPAVATVAELLRDDPGIPVQTVAHIFDHDRHELVRQLVALRRGEHALPDDELEAVLGHLRRALRLVADREAGVPVADPGSPAGPAPTSLASRAPGAGEGAAAGPDAGAASGTGGESETSLKKPSRSGVSVRIGPETT